MKINKILVVLALISAVGFTLRTNDENKSENLAKDAETMLLENGEISSQINLVEYVDRGTMVASWYGPRFHGRKTANGEVFDQQALTAAHKKFKFGTILRITNPKNAKSVIVRINDRGPYARGRELDLSKAAATELEILDRGVAKLNIEQITLKGSVFPVMTLN